MEDWRVWMSVVEAKDGGGGISELLPGPEVELEMGTGPDDLYLSPHLRVEEMAGKGRGVVATQPLSRGTILAVEQGLGVAISDSDHCVACARALQPDAISPCPSCPALRLCSRACWEDELHHFHWIQCQKSPLDDGEFDKVIRLAARILVATPPHLRRLWSSKTRVQFTDNLHTIQTNMEAYIALTASLPAHEDLISKNPERFAEHKQKLRRLAKLFCRQDPKHASLRKVTKQLIHICKICSTNTFCLFSWGQSSAGKSASLREQLGEKMAGIGIFPAVSLLNHSCRPNCARFFDGDKMEMRVVRDVAAGEELTTTYGSDPLNQTTYDRQMKLRSWEFDCACADACGSQLFRRREAEFWGFVCPSCSSGPAMPVSQSLTLISLFKYVVKQGNNTAVIAGPLRLNCLDCKVESALDAANVRKSVLALLVLHRKVDHSWDLRDLVGTLHPSNQQRILTVWVLERRRAASLGYLDQTALDALLASHRNVQSLLGSDMSCADDALSAARAITAFPRRCEEAETALKSLEEESVAIAAAHFGEKGRVIAQSAFASLP